MTGPTPGRARLGVSLMFFTNGVLFAALLPRYPELKDDFGLGNAAFGLVVVAFPLGALLAAAFAGRLIRRFGTLRTNAVGSVGLAVAMAAAAAGDVRLFVVALLLAGALDAVVDAAQNVQGVLVERWRGRSVLNSLHAVWSLGAATGGVLGAAGAAADVAPAVQMVVNGAVWAVVAVVACRLARVPAGVVTEEAGPEQGAGDAPAPSAWRLLLPLVLLAICGTLVEDVANTWAVLLARTETTAPAVVAGLALTVVLGSQLVGRLLGDPMTDRWGRAAVARTGGLLVAAGALLVAASPPWPLVMVGLGLTGLGSATLVPMAFAEAGRLRGLPEGTGIAVLGWLMRVGFLVTSPVIGLLSDRTSLSTAMLVPAGAGLVAATIAHRRGRRRA